MREVNIPLLRKAVEWVESQAALPGAEREWHQEIWFISAEDTHLYTAWGKRLAEQALPSCGTACCVAGWVASQEEPLIYHHQSNMYYNRKGEEPAIAAARLLGLTDSQADHLFSASNSAADIRRIAEGIAGETL